MVNQNGYEQEHVTVAHPVKSDHHALTVLNLAHLSIEHDEIDSAADDAEPEPSGTYGFPTNFDEDIKAGKKIIDWFSKLETPGHSNLDMYPPKANHVYQGDPNDLSSQASIASIKVGHHPFEAFEDDKPEPTYDREI